MTTVYDATTTNVTTTSWSFSSLLMHPPRPSSNVLYCTVLLLLYCHNHPVQKKRERLFNFFSLVLAVVHSRLICYTKSKGMFLLSADGVVFTFSCFLVSLPRKVITGGTSSTTCNSIATYKCSTSLSPSNKKVMLLACRMQRKKNPG